MNRGSPAGPKVGSRGEEKVVTSISKLMSCLGWQLQVAAGETVCPHPLLYPGWWHPLKARGSGAAVALAQFPVPKMKPFLPPLLLAWERSREVGKGGENPRMLCSEAWVVLLALPSWTRTLGV